MTHNVVQIRDTAEITEFGRMDLGKEAACSRLNKDSGEEWEEQWEELGAHWKRNVQDLQDSILQNQQVEAE